MVLASLILWVVMQLAQIHYAVAEVRRVRRGFSKPDRALIGSLYASLWPALTLLLLLAGVVPGLVEFVIGHVGYVESAIEWVWKRFWPTLFVGNLVSFLWMVAIWLCPPHSDAARTSWTSRMAGMIAAGIGLYLAVELGPWRIESSPWRFDFRWSE